MANARAIAAIKISDVLRPKGGDEVPINPHAVPARNESEPDYDAMRRIVSGESEDENEDIAREREN